jgi:DNA polymerase-3 subunit delta
MDALAFLDRPHVHPLYVVHGDEDFLRRQVLQTIRRTVLGEGDNDLSYSAHAGEAATFAAVVDELQTVPFFGDRRLVVVENADPFVTNYRAALEKLAGDLPSTGSLVLDVKTWPSNTRLARMVDAAATLVCKAPPQRSLEAWCVKWAPSRHGKAITQPAAALLLDLVGSEMGLLDQELLKLAVYVGDRQRIDVDDVHKLVGRSRDENVFKIMEAVGTGDSKTALTMLVRLLDGGEEPLRLLGALASQLRRLAQAARLTLSGRPLGVAIEDAGVLPFNRKAAEGQLKYLGRKRAVQLYDWLLEVNLGQRGGSALPPRTLLERLVVRLARKA